MARTFLLLLLVMWLVSPGRVLAQGIEACQFCVTIKDLTCTEGSCTPDIIANCEFKTFTPTCAGEYTVRVRTICDNGHDCADCVACLMLVREGEPQILLNLHNACGLSSCEATNYVRLDDQSEYKVYLCRLNCPSFPPSSCEDCDENCHVEAAIWINGAPCPAP